MTALADARALLAGALETVLPGRVDPYGVTRIQRGVAPFIWIDTSSGSPSTIGSSTEVWVETFTVRAVVDGNTAAQLAMLDDIASAVVDAIRATPGLRLVSKFPADIFIDSSHSLRGCEFHVAVTIAARTFCPPDTVTAAFVPPNLIPA